MNDNAKKWVAALRSGKYTQGRKYLNKDNTFCCLGVACEVAIDAGVPVRKDTTDDGVVYYDYSSKSLYDQMQAWLGLESTQYEGGSLIRDNDILQLTFSQIADIIESEPKGLFV